MNGLLRVAMAFLGLILAAGPGAAQSPPAKPPPVTTHGDLDYVSDPLRIESIGMSMRLPLNADVTTTQTGTLVRSTIRDRKHNWVINIETPRTENPAVTAADAAKKTLETRMFSSEIKDSRTGERVGAVGKILEQVHNLRVAGVATPGERFYISQPQGASGNMVQGFTIFKTGPQQFLAFELICAEALYPAARRVYESAIATVRIEDAGMLELERRDAITAGTAFISRLSGADYDAATEGPVQLYRLYRPAASGAPMDATERGYRTLQFFKGARAQIDPKSRDTTASASNPAGYLAEVRARLVEALPTGGLAVTDVQGRYFMSADRKEEAWSLAMSTQDPGGGQSKGPLVYTETGTRSGSIMTVIVNRPGQTDPIVRPAVPPEGYLNQVEAFMLPRLLVASGIEADLGFYAYNWSTSNVALRRDSASMEAAMPGVVRIVTRPREGAEPLTYLYRAKGELLRGDMGEGTVMEPIWPDDLLKLWKAKGLPTESLASAPGKGR